MASSSSAIVTSWGDMKLLPPVAEALVSLGWAAPTTVQGAAIPPLLKGQDVSLQGATGTGKTAAFVIPIVQRIVAERATKAPVQGPTAMILTPSVELAEQTVAVVDQIAKFIKPRIHTDNSCDPTRPPSVASNIIVGTPAAVAQQLKRGVLPASVVSGLRVLVVDEADVLVAMASLASIQRLLPSVLQTVLVSATLTEGVATIKEQLLRNPTNIKLTEEETEGPAGGTDDIVVDARRVRKNQLHHHYIVATTEAHNYTLLYSLFRLNVLQGKSLIFVDDEDHTYKLQHFLEQLSIATVVYDASLPLNVRLDVLKRFQRNSSGTMIVTDATLEKAERLQVDLSAEDREAAGLTRGVDFHNVRNVILFDGVPAPTAINFAAYTHRAGRTGRAGAEGNVVTIFTVPQAHEVTRNLREYLKKTRNEPLRPLKQLDRAAAARMQYRVDSALGNVTRNAARKLRVATVASELARSTYLNAHMSQSDTGALKKIVAKVKDRVRADKALASVPRYMGLQADSVASYRKRVKAQHPLNREEIFKRVSAKKAQDPLQRVVDTVRRKEEFKKGRVADRRDKARKSQHNGGARNGNNNGHHAKGGGRPTNSNGAGKGAFSKPANGRRHTSGNQSARQ
jgi:ATP-dependent RNA helicase DDX56/DBP9